MARAGVLAAGLLSLTLSAACSQDQPQRTTAARAADAPAAASSAATASAPAVRAETAVGSSAAGTSPQAVATVEAPTTAATPSPGAAPRPAAPAPRATKEAVAASSKPAPSPTAAARPPASPSRTPAPSSRFALTIRDFAFSPRVLTISVGSTVTASNQDEATHDWTSRSSVWRSGDLPQGASYSFTFPTSGTFDYLCERHPQMTGTITVTPG